jgi:putative transposase
MALRQTPLVTDEIYHIFNKGVDSRPIFLVKKDYQRFIETINFYQFLSPPMRLFRFLQLSNERKAKILHQLETDNKRLVKIIAYCLIPNHFHFILEQQNEPGISFFLAQLQNSYTRYFNTKYKRVGHLLQGQFKAVRVEGEAQLIHLSRYIHLNPYSSFLIRDLSRLEEYSWSSFPDYLGIRDKNPFLENQIVLSLFKTTDDYKKFVFDRADYQRTLDVIKHLTFEN